MDVEAAIEAAHRAESAIALREWPRAWGPALLALFVAEREFMPGDDSPWIDAQRQQMADVHLRALEAYAATGLGVGGTELAAAARAGRRLVKLAPFRESGYELLMRALSRQGNPAEALRVHSELCHVLRDELVSHLLQLRGRSMTSSFWLDKFAYRMGQRHWEWQAHNGGSVGFWNAGRQ